MRNQLATGRKIRIPTAFDTLSRCVPLLDARFNRKGEYVVTTLERVCRQLGYLKAIKLRPPHDKQFSAAKLKIKSA